MIADGIRLEELNQNKIQQLGYIISGILTEAEYNTIGDFIFVRSEVPLVYLYAESRKRLEEYIQQNQTE